MPKKSGGTYRRKAKKTAKRMPLGGKLLLLLLVLLFGVGGYLLYPSLTEESGQNGFSLDNIPAFTDQAYVALEENRPAFTEEEITATAFEQYAPLDTLGRCGTALASVGQELMPTEDRGSIGSVKPSGWQTVKYDIVDGKYLYNRCHLIGFQLTGENANERNLITGTRYLNIKGMLPFENQVADYVKETGNHVMYRVTPIFQGDELVARGVEMEGYSVEDEGDGISFHIFAYNCQPGIVIDYATGDSHLDEGSTVAARNWDAIRLCLLIAAPRRRGESLSLLVG